MLKDAPAPHQTVLDLCVRTLRAAGPLTAAQLAGRLVFLIDGVDERTIVSVLEVEGVAQVRRDEDGRYRLR